MQTVSSPCAGVNAGGGLLPHAHLRRGQLKVATVRLVSKTMQSHTEEPVVTSTHFHRSLLWTLCLSILPLSPSSADTRAHNAYVNIHGGADSCLPHYDVGSLRMTYTCRDGDVKF